MNLRHLFLFLFLSCACLAYAQPSGQWYCCGNVGMADKITLYSAWQNCSATKCVYTSWDFRALTAPGTMSISSSTCCPNDFTCDAAGIGFNYQYDPATQRISLVSGATTYIYTITKQTATELELVLVK